MEQQHQPHSSVAKERWKYLAQALLKDKPVVKSFVSSQFSVRNFDGFDLYDKASKEDYVQYKLKGFLHASGLTLR